MPLVIFVPLTLNIKMLPSFTLDAAGVTLYVGGVVLVSFIVTALLVASTVPLVLPERIETVNDSAPSVVKSAVGVTVKVPLLLVIANEPVSILKSALADVTLLIDQ